MVPFNIFTTGLSNFGVEVLGGVVLNGLWPHVPAKTNDNVAAVK